MTEQFDKLKIFVTFQFYFNFVAVVLSFITYAAYKIMDPLGEEKEKALEERAKQAGDTNLARA